MYAAVVSPGFAPAIEVEEIDGELPAGEYAAAVSAATNAAAIGTVLVIGSSFDRWPASSMASLPTGCRSATGSRLERHVVWGPIFKDLDKRDAVSAALIESLVKYIESIQAKAKAWLKTSPKRQRSRHA